MKNKKLLAILALTVVCSMGLTACGFGGAEEEDVVVGEEAEPTEAVEPTATPEPEVTAQADIQTTLYISADGSIAIKLPDATWSNKTDQSDLVSFTSPEQGSILIEHGAGEEDLSTQIIPNSQDTAVVLEQGAGLTEGTDFEIQEYTSSEEDGYSVYSYVVKMNNTENYAYKICRFLANESEYYILTGTVTVDDAEVLANVRSAMENFAVMDESSTIKTAPLVEEEAQTSEEGTEGTEGGTENAEDAQETASNGGIVPYRDNPDNTDTNKTRTIYRNSDGHPIVISINEDGVWVDEDGNQYRFSTVYDSAVYDQNDVDYYYHGEAADVYFMPVEEE